jgi:ATP-binding protein involved in chromosome partitioning
MPDVSTSGMIMPLEAFGVRVMSIGFLVDGSQPIIWRGPMISSAIGKMLHEVDWGNLDILLIDLPPGTGDVQLSIAQKAPLSGAVIVSTPQDLALIDARRAIGMFEKLAVPVIGLIENMSSFCCPNCGHETAIFGHQGARQEAAERNIAFLGEIPLHLEIRTCADTGQPIAVAGAQGHYAGLYDTIANGLSAALMSLPARRRSPRVIMPQRSV